MGWERPAEAPRRERADRGGRAAGTDRRAAFGPLLRPGGRFFVTASDFGTLRSLGPHLHSRFDTAHMTLDDLDATMLDYVDLVESGRDIAAGWPESVNAQSTTDSWSSSAA
jgi:hypothetical protein